MVKERKGDHLYLDEASHILSESIGMHLPEKQILKIAESIGLDIFSIGTKLAISHEAFVDRFSEFVLASTVKTRAKKKNRSKGAITFNQQIDGFFAYMEYASSKGNFDLRQCLAFLKFFDKEAFSGWTLLELKAFARKRGLRNGGAADARRAGAYAEFEKAMASAEQAKDKRAAAKRDNFVKTANAAGMNLVDQLIDLTPEGKLLIADVSSGDESKTEGGTV